MDPILKYETGHPTRLPNHGRLVRMLRELGSPTTIQPIGGSFALEWPPIFPGVPIPQYQLPNPWPTDKRSLVSVTLG